MLGGIEETSASFEARSAPRSYPTVAPAIAFPEDTIMTKDQKIICNS